MKDGRGRQNMAAKRSRKEKQMELDDLTRGSKQQVRGLKRFRIVNDKIMKIV